MLTEEQLEDVKRDGSRQILLNRASNCIWSARQRLEAADKNDWKNFTEELARARNMLDEAEQQYQAATALIKI